MTFKTALPLVLACLFSTHAPGEEQEALPAAPAGMSYIPGGTYTRGEDRDLGGTARYPEEAPVHEVTVSAFFIDQTEVTNGQFMAFVKATGYRTQAERGLSREDFPQAPAEQLQAGALVFQAPEEEVDKWQPGAEWQWWQFVPGANWQHPTGPDSSITAKMDHPVVCLTKEDAEAYAEWAGKRLPTEAEWERAARGNHDHALFTWGKSPKPDAGQWPANSYQGDFPNNNRALDGYAGTAPVKSFPPNDFGLYDMAGNVWEFCADLYRPDYYQMFVKNPEPNPTGPTAAQAITQPETTLFARGMTIPEEVEVFHPLARLWVVKGGSYLCHHTYCLRYRPAARHYAESLSPTNHTGFRCVKDLPTE
ncbi:formylglycine-generating enzyme family protein [Roseibacillus ishigakijimensis]|uniref:Formylglycine-generating enzyme family protein n=1 Tax=Roseibacillus ishigakijimensis TaxID=454146 RepID=A0A934VM92_9BACT|nr:formylglycine-generating enzyme family protein [Roseibacillus ishigakijimensis]MBK1834032.1 formylglycine-generating enzyme family protein [Roseibacillus ishigakijimensis]